MNRVTLSDSFAAGLLPKRNEGGDKTAFGNALVIAGSPGFTGAPFFSAMTCQRCGAGLVRLAVPSEIHEIESIKLNEVMVKAISCEDSNEAVIAAYLELVGKSDAVLVGPGISVTDRSRAMVRSIISSSSVPVILDADALNCLAGEPEILRLAKCDVIITPHAREFARLFSFNRVPVDSELLKFSSDYNVTIVYKCSETRIASPSGRICINSGMANSGMAKGGSGDVLAGMILAFLSQGVKAFDSAALAVRIHSIAGKIARDRFTEYCMLPSDVIDCLPDAFKFLGGLGG